ncbi:MAG: phospholipid carrier-dependent glycosyltransferase, partial [Candidatus Thioglobus sp.]|nr:phospholipid carrier-dependent glycosyltransferase [Candidatus Thioglobus sp.]
MYLGEIPGPVFDEVFYPMYGYSYLTDQQFFYVHPPLGNYILAAAIWIYHQLPWIEVSSLSTVSFEELPTLSYRWLNALSGSLLCILSYILSQKLFNNNKFSLLVCFFVAIDGSLLVDSRIGLINIYLVFFGLCALICAVKAKFVDLQNRNWLILCGVFIGLAASIKWNGLGYLFTILTFIAFVISVRTIDALRFNHPMKEMDGSHNLVENNITFSWEYVLYFLIIPLVVYSLIWIPDLRLNTEYNFLEKHQQLLGFHQIMVTEDEHPYCSKWYSWPFMMRPMGYYFNSYEIIGHLGNKTTMFQDIHLFPNP